MFADSFCESTWAQTSRRGWTALASFALQCMGIALLLLLPLIYTQGLPEFRLIPGVALPTVPPGRSPETMMRTNRGRVTSNFRNGILMTPTRIPTVTPLVDDRETVPAPDGNIGVVGAPSRHWDPNGVIHSILTDSNRAYVPPKPTISHPLTRTSSMMQGYLVHRVQPVYPQPARDARIQGPVRLHAVIGKDGTIENLHVLGGHPMLVTAAVDAVRQWRYRPYILNGEPVEVETQITVNFILSGS